MPKLILKKASWVLLASACLAAVIINGCKKDSRADQQNSVTDPAIVQAKIWYENAYPINNKLGIQATTGNKDLSQLVKPNWEQAATYNKSNQQVVDIPIDQSAEFYSLLSNISAKRAYSKSSFLLLKDGQKYDAYIMTIIADSVYLKNDFNKLSHNKYNHRDVDFSGVVLYNTPNGDFVSGWIYKNGKVTRRLPISKNSNHTTVQSIHDNKKSAMAICTDWWQETYVGDNLVDRKYLGTTCQNGGGTDIDMPAPPDGGGGDGGFIEPGGSPDGGVSGDMPNETGSINLPNLDVSALNQYPKFKALASDLPNFLKKYPNITAALAYYTGFNEAQIIQLMQPGKGPKVITVPNLKNSYGAPLYGHYDRLTKTIEIDESFAKGLEVAQSEITIQATGLLLAITTLHEFIHYGRDQNKLTELFQGYEAGWTFEMNINPDKTGIDKNNAIDWINYYPYNFK